MVTLWSPDASAIRSSSIILLHRVKGFSCGLPAIVIVAASGVVTVTMGVDDVAVSDRLKEPSDRKEFICCVRPNSPPSATVTMTQITSDTREGVHTSVRRMGSAQLTAKSHAAGSRHTPLALVNAGLTGTQHLDRQVAHLSWFQGIDQKRVVRSHLSTGREPQTTSDRPFLVPCLAQKVSGYKGVDVRDWDRPEFWIFQVLMNRVFGVTSSPSPTVTSRIRVMDGCCDCCVTSSRGESKSK